MRKLWQCLRWLGNKGKGLNKAFRCSSNQLIGCSGLVLVSYGFYGVVFTCFLVNLCSRSCVLGCRRYCVVFFCYIIFVGLYLTVSVVCFLFGVLGHGSLLVLGIVWFSSVNIIQNNLLVSVSLGPLFFSWFSSVAFLWDMNIVVSFFLTLYLVFSGYLVL